MRVYTVIYRFAPTYAHILSPLIIAAFHEGLVGQCLLEWKKKAQAAVGHPGLGASAPTDSGKELTPSWQAGLETLGI